MRFYFTFGFGQPHENGFHVIESKTYDEAREEMFKKFGNNWSMQYSEKEWFAHGKSQEELYKLHEVK